MCVSDEDTAIVVDKQVEGSATPTTSEKKNSKDTYPISLPVTESGESDVDDATDSGGEDGHDIIYSLDGECEG